MDGQKAIISTDWTPGNALARMRGAQPLVHCITNYVAMTPAANVLLAAGASPAMVMAEEEMADFVPVADALTVNIGTLSASSLNAMRHAVEVAGQADVPWVLDPVALYASGWRFAATRELLAGKPALIRANASEILALAGESTGGKGADAADSVEDAREAAIRLAQTSGAVVAVTGAVDFVTDGARHARVRGGSPYMARLTATGCSLTALCGAYIASEDHPLPAAVAALALFAAAGLEAGQAAKGPGSFLPLFLDAVAATTPEALDAAALVDWL